MSGPYETVIGLEVHVQLKTKSKMFTRVPYGYGEEPNTLGDPVIFALPGALPVLNMVAVEKTIQTGLLLGCKIPEVCKWDRKNYFYPDSPKNYQISQYDQPLCLGGGVEIEMANESRSEAGPRRVVELTRIHLEEDVGKLTHVQGGSLVDYNRAGCALIEIVTEPDLYSADEAFAFLTSLRTILIYADISDCDMEKGQLRCDANVSIRPRGTKALGQKVEIKNLNSISGVRNGINYEIRRQTALAEAGRPIVQETRRWDADAGATTSMRTKEDAHDYRYFPDPDLLPVRISEEWKERLAKELPELPFRKQERFERDYELPYPIASVLCTDRVLADFFEESVRYHPNPKIIANLIVNNLLQEVSSGREDTVTGQSAGEILRTLPVQPKDLGALVRLIDDGTISSQIAKEILPKMLRGEGPPGEIVDREGLRQQTDESLIVSLCEEVIQANPKAVQEFRDGNEKAINALKGRVMKGSGGKANPGMVDGILRRILEDR
ncbi:MAG: Asp-tRNA(Asn)/Glu-tRNA(Gln) amidotransferase subunit GatB [Puniceicoccaceae bacterium]